MKTWKKIKKIALVAGMSALVIGACGCISDSQHQEDAEQAKLDALNTACGEGTVLTDEKCVPVKTDAEGKLITITEPDQTLIPIFEELLNEDYEFGEEIAITYNDHDVKTLIDGKIDFDDEDYDVHEEIEFDGIKTVSIDGAEYLEVPNGAVKYNYVLDDEIDKNDISEETPLKIKFLGKDIEIVDWGSNSITLKKGNKLSLGVGDYTEIDGKKVTLENVGMAGAIQVNVDGDIEVIPEGTSEIVNDVEISNIETFYEQDKDERTAWLMVGKDNFITIKDGDSYGEDLEDEDAVLEWEIGEDKLTLANKQDYDDLNKRHKFKALAKGESIEFGDYFKVINKGLEDVDKIHYTISLDKKGEYVELVSNDDEGFIIDGEEYKKVLLSVEDEVYNFYDWNDEEILGNEAELGETGHTLNAGLTLTFGDVEIVLSDLSELEGLELSGEDISDEEDDQLAFSGDSVSNPEDNFDDNEVVLDLAEEDPEATVAIEARTGYQTPVAPVVEPVVETPVE